MNVSRWLQKIHKSRQSGPLADHVPEPNLPYESTTQARQGNNALIRFFTFWNLFLWLDQQDMSGQGGQAELVAGGLFGQKYVDLEILSRRLFNEFNNLVPLLQIAFAFLALETGLARSFIVNQ